MVRPGQVAPPLTSDGSAPILVVSGPTASGKSDLALRLAVDLDGEIVNLDSVQVWRGFDIGAAKLPREQRLGIQHHMIDIRGPGETFNAAAYLREAEKAIADIRGRGRLPILAGGTTMYLTLLLHGLAKMPAGDPVLRADLEAHSSTELHAMLAARDPQAATRLHVNDRLRVIRALETVMISGQSCSDGRAAHAYGEQRHKALMLVPLWPREELYKRIDQRSQLMLAAGLIEETKALLELYGPDAPALQSLGYAQGLSYLKGEIAEADLAGLISQFTRRYAKRQMTYWRNEPAKRGWICRPEPGTEGALRIAAEAPHAKRGAAGFSAFSFDYETLRDWVRSRMMTDFDASEVWYFTQKGT